MAAKGAEPPAPQPRKGIFDALFGRGSFSGGDAPTAEQKALDKKTLWETLAPKAHGHGARSGRDIDAYDQHIGNIGPEGLGWQRPADEAALSTEELKATRAYARDVETDSLEEVISACSENVRRYGVRSISAPCRTATDVSERSRCAVLRRGPRGAAGGRGGCALGAVRRRRPGRAAAG